MVSPYLERRLRSYREALREIRKRHAKRRAGKALKTKTSQDGGHIRLVHSGSKGRSPEGSGKDA